MDVDYASAFGVIGVREPGGHVGVPHHGEQFYGLVSVCHRAVLPSGLAPQLLQDSNPRSGVHGDQARLGPGPKSRVRWSCRRCLEACGER